MSLRAFLLVSLCSAAAWAGECPPLATTQYLLLSHADLQSDVETRMGEKKLCEAAEISGFLAEAKQNPVEKAAWAIRAFAIYRQQDDLSNAFVLGKRVFSQMGVHLTDVAIEDFRFAVLQLVQQLASKLGTERDGQWLEMFTQANPPAYADADLFAKDFPSSRHLPAVTAIKAEMQEKYLARELDIAQILARRGNWLAAIWRLETVCAQEWMLDSSQLPELIAVRVQYLLQMREYIQSPAWTMRRETWDDPRLRVAFDLPGVEVDLRDRVRAILLERATAAVDLMRAEFPQSPATAKAVQLLAQSTN